MSIYCAYQHCDTVRVPLCNTPFFRLPTDGRRDLWIENSGNPELKKIKATAARFFCIKHFVPNDLRVQFNRTILRREAVPIKFVEEPSEAREEEQLVELELEGESIAEDVEIILEEIACSNKVPTNISEYQSSNIDENVCREISTDTTQNQLIMHIDEEVDDFIDLITEKENDNTPNLEQIPDSTQESVVSIPSNHKNIEHMKETSLRTIQSVPSSELNTNTNTASQFENYEEDKHFVLSLVGYFQRLPKKKKSMAKLAILNYLTQLELDD